MRQERAPTAIDVTHLFAGRPERPPATPELVAWAQRELGVTLPDAYKSLVMVRNGGRLYKDTLLSTEQPLWWNTFRPAYTVQDPLYGVDRDAPNSITAIGHRGEADGLVTISGGGRRGVCLDYREDRSTSEPRVIHYESADDSPDGQPAEFVVAPTFDAFLRGLRLDFRGAHMLDVTAFGDGDVDEALARAGATLSPNARGDAMVWRLSGYRAFHNPDGSPVTEITAIGNASGRAPGGALLPGLSPSARLLRVIVSFEDARACIAALMTALGSRAKIAHAPIDGPSLG